MKNAIVQQMAVAPANRGLDWIKTSLQAAIELELSTLPPYLCAMWSIRDSSNEPGKGAYTLIDSIVRQEMGHMGLVCNMLTAVGGRPQIAAGYAENVQYPGKLPGGVRQQLTVFLSGLTKPFVHDVLMQIEFPENEIVLLEALAVHTFPTIGAFYDALSDAFTRVKPDIDKNKQLSSPAVGVKPLASLDDVHAAIALIKTQGEGSSTSPADGGPDDELAHYYRFAELYIGKKIVKTAGGFAFAGDPVPFPDTITVPPIPTGGFPGVSSEVGGLLASFDKLFSDMLDDLDTAWKNTNQASLGLAVGKMLQLRGAANNIMMKPLPKAVNGFYAPTFQYIPVSQRTAAAPGGAQAPAAGGSPGAGPRFSDITNLLATLAGNDPNIGDAPHGAFWTDDYDTFIAQKTDDWGVPGNLVVKGNPDQSVLLQALSGPFSGLPQMPDTDADPKGRHATQAELNLVSTWITNGCPK